MISAKNRIGHIVLTICALVRTNSLTLTGRPRTSFLTGFHTRKYLSHRVPHITERLRGGFVAPSMMNTSDLKNDGSSNHSNNATKSVPSLEELQASSLALYEKLRSCKDGYMSAPLNSALNILADALRLYGPEQLFASYNGGKDAEVLLHLMRAVFAKYSADQGIICQPKLIYFAVTDEFKEVLAHLNDSERMLRLDLKRYDCGISTGLGQHIEGMKASAGGHHVCPAFVLGTRRGDPNCGDQQAFSPSSSWMPAFMRVNPILDWDYGHVWHFLRTYNLPYCELYDRGYTSLGKTTDTKPNPALLRKTLSPATSFNTLASASESVVAGTTSTEDDRYWPAYMLSDWSLERAGRISKEKTPSTTAASSSSSGNSCSVSTTTTKSPGLGSATHTVRTAGMIVIGDEILNGFTTEVNMKVAATSLSAIGIPLKRVSIVSDDLDEIAKEVTRMSQAFDIVITSGGIGPTHDDVTLKAIAAAFKQEITVSKEMMDHLEEIHAAKDVDIQMDESMKRLALLPEHSTLLWVPAEEDLTSTTPTPTTSSSSSTMGTTIGSGIDPRNSGVSSSSSSSGSAISSSKSTRRSSKEWPVLRCDNLFVLPGIPQFFANKMNLITKHFVKTSNMAIETHRIVLDVEESKIVELLDGLVARHPKVKFGSYPFVDHPEFKTIISVENKGYGDRENEIYLVDEAVQSLLTEVSNTYGPLSVLRVERERPPSSAITNGGKE